MKLITIATSIIAAIKSVWMRGGPFAAATALFATDEEGKYAIQAEGIQLVFTNHGGALANLWINDTQGNEVDVVMGFDHANDYLKYPGNPYLNGAIGRYAGVISDAQFELDGLVHKISANGNGGTITWNGGEHGWGHTTLDIGSHTENNTTFVLFDRSWNGFPGTAAACLTHAVTPYEWRITFGVTPTRKPSPINMSQQVFWNLDGFAANTSLKVTGHHLHIPFSGLRIDLDEKGVPTGDLKANKQSSAYDFWSSGKSIGRGLNQMRGSASAMRDVPHAQSSGYDETFLISRAQPWKRGDHPVARLSSIHSGISVELYTDQEALHMHTWNEGQRQIKLKRTQGSGVVPLYGAISMEMQDWMDGIKHPEWQREGRTVWGTDGLYTTFSSFRFTVDKKE